MSITVYPTPSAEAKLTPLTGNFDYNFTDTVSGQSIVVDFTDEIPSGTYSISGVSLGGHPVWKIQVLTSNNTVVGESLTTYSGEGSWGSNNGSPYSATISVSSAFTKLKLIGIDGLRGVYFNNATPAAAGTYHLSIKPGTKNIISKSIWQKIIDAGEATNISTSGINLPSGFPYQYWYYNGKLYVWYTSINAGTTPTGTTNDMGIRAYNLSTSTWESPIVTFNPTIMSAQPYAVPVNSSRTSTNNAVYVFKNGNVLFRVGRMYNTSGSTTQSYDYFSFFFNLSAGTVTNKTGSWGGASQGLHGPSAYVPVEDSWYVTGYQNNNNYPNAVRKITNDGTISLTTSVNGMSSSYGHLWVENSTTPKIAVWAGNSNNTGMYWRSINSSGTVTGTVTNSTSIISSTVGTATYDAQVFNVFIDADHFGLTNSSLRVDVATSSPNIYFQNYTYPTANELDTESYRTFVEDTIMYRTRYFTPIKDDNGSALNGYFQPISSTDYAMVWQAGIGNNLQSRANITITPISSSNQTIE